MNIRLTILRGVIGTIVYVAMSIPVMALFRYLPDEMPDLVELCVLYTSLLCLLSAFFIGMKFSRWLFKGVEVNE